MPSQIDEVNEELRELLRRKADGLEPLSDDLRRTLRRSDRRLARNGLVTLLTLALVGTAAVAGLRSLGRPSSKRPAGRSPSVTIAANGAFAIARADGIYRVQPDGSGLRKITGCPLSDCDAVAAPAWSPDGSKIVFAALPKEGGSEAEGLFLVNSDGSGLARITECAPAGCGMDQDPAWSPDGSRIVFTRIAGAPATEGTIQLYVVNADGSGLRRLTDLPGYAETPAWSPDGTKIAFDLQGENGQSIDVIDVNGSNRSVVLEEPSGSGPGAPAWSPGGTKLAFVMSAVDGGSPDVFVMNADGSRVTRLRNDPAPEVDPVWSRDGTKIAFVRTGSGGDLYVMDADGRNPRLVLNGVLGRSWQPLPAR